MSDLVRTSHGGLSYMTDMMGIQARNMDALHKAGQAMLDGIGVLARHQADTIGSVLARPVSAKLPVLTSGPYIAAAIGDGIDALKTGITETQARSNILSELTARSAGAVSTILQTRLLAALDEYKAALQHAVPEQPKAAAAPVVAPVAVAVPAPVVAPVAAPVTTAKAKAPVAVAALTPDAAPARVSAA